LPLENRWPPAGLLAVFSGLLVRAIFAEQGTWLMEWRLFPVLCAWSGVRSTSIWELEHGRLRVLLSLLLEPALERCPKI
jgi:hypothetical protein